MRSHITSLAVSPIAACSILIGAVAASSGQVNQPPVPDLGTRRFGHDWPAFLGPTGDSKSAETGIRKRWENGALRVVWQRTLGESYGVCAVAKGRLFQFDRHQGQGRLACLNSETGEELWKFQYPYDYRDLYGYNSGPRCSPIVDDDRVYIFDVAGHLQCVRVLDGKPLWTVDTEKDFGVVQNFFGVGSNPVVHGDLLIAMIGGSPPESQKVAPGELDRVIGNGTGIVAFNKYTGKAVYKLSDELASYASLKLARLDGRPWCFAFARGGLVAFHPETGKLDFEYPWRASILQSVNASVPVVAGNEVLISETYGPGSSLLKFRPGGYEVVWKDNPRRRDKAMQAHWNTPILHEEHLYGCSGRHSYDAELRCIEWKTGKVMWSKPGLTRASLMYADGHFVCLSEDGTLRLIKANPREYELVSQVRLLAPSGNPLLQPPAWAAPILAHGLLYVRGADRLVCLELIPPPNG